MADEFNMDEVIAKAIEAVEAREAERAAKEAEKESELKELEDKIRAEVEEDYKALYRSKGISVRTEDSLTDPLKGDHTGKKAYLHWMRTGDLPLEMHALEDPEGIKTAFQGQDEAEGGYTVPDDFLGEIIAQRNWMSWPRGAGVRTMQTSLDKVNIPTEATQFSNLARTAEEGSYDTDAAALGQVSITVHKFTKIEKVSEELLADNKADLEGFMARAVGEQWGLTESHYCATGTGSNQPEGVFVGGDTDALTLTCTHHILAAEIPELASKLRSGYRRDAVWLMDPATEGAIRQLRDANDFAFPIVNVQTRDRRGEFPGHYSELYGFPVFTDDNIDVGAASTCIIMLGSPRYYMLVEREGLVMARNPYLYQASGQVGFFWRARFGGAVLQELAWVGGITAGS